MDRMMETKNKIWIGVGIAFVLFVLCSAVYNKGWSDGYETTIYWRDSYFQCQNVVYERDADIVKCNIDWIQCAADRDWWQNAAYECAADVDDWIDLYDQCDANRDWWQDSYYYCCS